MDTIIYTQPSGLRVELDWGRHADGTYWCERRIGKPPGTQQGMYGWASAFPVLRAVAEWAQFEEGAGSVEADNR